MKNVNFPQTKGNTELVVQNEKSVALEPISLVELAEVLGGNNVQDQETIKDNKDKDDKGHAGGLVCWC